MRRILSGCLRSGQPAQRRQLRAGPGKEMGQHPRGRAAPRRHRRTRRLQACATTVPRRLRRLLSERQTDKERSREEMDREYSLENGKRQRSGIAPENLRYDEVSYVVKIRPAAPAIIYCRPSVSI